MNTVTIRILGYFLYGSTVRAALKPTAKCSIRSTRPGLNEAVLRYSVAVATCAAEQMLDLYYANCRAAGRMRRDAGRAQRSIDEPSGTLSRIDDAVRDGPFRNFNLSALRIPILTAHGHKKSI